MATQFLSQTPNALNLELRQNQNWSVAFSYTDSTGTIISLDGYSPILQFRTSALAKTTSLALTTSNGITFSPDSLPQIHIDVQITCTPGKYQWDLALVPTSGNSGNIFLSQGTVTVDAEVSR